MYANNDKNDVVFLLETSSFHGLSNFFRSEKKIFKFIWAVCFVISSLACLYFVVKTFISYYGYQVNSQISIVDDFPFRFPAVTICNKNSMIKKEAVDLFEKILIENNMTFLSEQIEHLITDPVNFNISKNTVDMFSSTKLIIMAIAFANLNRDEKQKLGLTKEEMISDLKFNLVDYDIDKLAWYYDMYYGNCFKFNSGVDFNGNPIAIEYATMPGLFNGLTMRLFVGNIDREVLSLSDVSEGFQIFIDENDQPSNLLSGIDIKTGAVNTLIVSKTIIEKLPSPYSGCVMGNYKLGSNQFSCRNLCIQQDTIKACGCYNPMLDALDSKKPCQNIIDFTCMFQVFQNLSYSSSINECIRINCPIACKRIMFETKSYISDYPSELNYNILRATPSVRENFKPDELTYENIRKKYAYVNVYFEELRYMSIKEVEAMTGIDLFSSIGGTMGLFIGISVLSLVEVIEILCLAVAEFFKKSTNPNQINVKPFTVKH